MNKWVALAVALGLAGSVAAADPALKEAPVLAMVTYSGNASWEGERAVEPSRNTTARELPSLGVDRSLERISATLGDQLEQRMLRELTLAE